MWGNVPEGVIKPAAELDLDTLDSVLVTVNPAHGDLRFYIVDAEGEHYEVYPEEYVPIFI